MEHLAAFSKLLANRLDGVPAENVDLRGITLTGYDIKAREPVGGGDGSGDDEGDGQAPGIMLKPVGAGGSSRPGTTPAYLQEIIERLNSLFGDAAPLSDKISFVNQIASITRASDVVMAQVNENPKEQALRGNLPGAVQKAVVRAMTSNRDLAKLVLKEDSQAIDILTATVYDLLITGERLDMGDIG